MRTTKKHLLAILLVLVAVLALSFTLAACNGDGQPVTPEQPEDPTTYTVTVTQYDAAQGTVTLEPANADGKYADGATVTVTVSAKAGFEVDAFTVSTDPTAALDSNGKYTLTVSADTTITATFKSTNVAVTSVTVTPAQSSLEVGRDDDQNKTVQLSADVLPANATDKAVTWTSENPTIATVSETGVVTAVAEGTATIKATAGGVEGTATVTVSTHAHAAAAGAEWQQDVENGKHFKLCECGAKVDEAVHAAAQEAAWQNEDGKHFKLCVCGERVEEGTCAAAPEAQWEADPENEQHYHECATCGEHIDVTNCSASDPDAWETNADEHYQECKDCFQQFNKANHTWSKPQPTEDGKKHQIGCTECTYKQEAVAHVRPENLTEATPVEGTTKSHSFACAECGGTMTEACASKSGTTIHLENIGVKEDENGKHVLYCKLCGNLSSRTNDQHTWDQSTTKRYTPGENGHHSVICSKSMSWYSGTTLIGSMSCTMEKDEACQAASTKKYILSVEDPTKHCEQCSKCSAPIESTKADHSSAAEKKYIPYGENNEQHIEACGACGVGFGTPSDHSRDENGHCACGDCTHLKLANVHDGFIDGTCAGCGEQVLFDLKVSTTGAKNDLLMKAGAEEKYLSSMSEIKLIIPYSIGGKVVGTVKYLKETNSIIENQVILSDATIAKIKVLSTPVFSSPHSIFSAVETIYFDNSQSRVSSFNDIGIPANAKTVIMPSGLNWGTGVTTRNGFAYRLGSCVPANVSEDLKIFINLDISTVLGQATTIEKTATNYKQKFLNAKSHFYFTFSNDYKKAEFEGYGGAFAFDDSGSDVVLGDFCKIKIMTDDDELKAKDVTYTIGISWREKQGTDSIKSTEVHFTEGGELTQEITITLTYDDLLAHTSWPNIQLYIKGGDLGEDTIYYANKTSCKYSGNRYSSSYWTSSSGKGDLWYAGNSGTITSGQSWTFTLTVQCDGTILACVIAAPVAA